MERLKKRKRRQKQPPTSPRGIALVRPTHLSRNTDELGILDDGGTVKTENLHVKDRKTPFPMQPYHEDVSTDSSRPTSPTSEQGWVIKYDDMVVWMPLQPTTDDPRCHQGKTIVRRQDFPAPIIPALDMMIGACSSSRSALGTYRRDGKSRNR